MHVGTINEMFLVEHPLGQGGEGDDEGDSGGTPPADIF